MSGTIKERVDELVRKSSSAGGQVAVAGEVVLHVDYQIIEHFSEHLYDSPNKAVEELVANSFDAFATEVRVFTPGEYTTSRVIVWDNGDSMDVQGLQQLWWIAKSPKSEGDRVEERGDRARKIIGKFGIGKLASYSVGEVISHVCRHGGDFYLVSIDYAQIAKTKDTPPESPGEPIRAPVVRLRETDATNLLTNLFDTPPPSMDEMLAGESWTFAVIEKLKVDDLPSGRLTWVLGNGMPLRPDFAVNVNEEQVRTKIRKEAVLEWDFGTEVVTKGIRQRWAEAEKQGEVSGTIELGHEKGLDTNAVGKIIPYIRFPNLGLVWGHVRLFDDTLLRYRAADHGRSHGFFLVVRGRLLNPEDDTLFLPDPSFQTFYRSQYVINADDLDKDLLANRQGLRQDDGTKELQVLQKALAGIARTTVEARDEKKEEEQSTRSILPVGSRTFYRDPLNALLLRAPIEESQGFNPTSVEVERVPLGENERISRVALEEGSFQVNTLHPYYSELEKRAGRSRAAREFLRTFDLFAISERLLEGHLLDIGIAEKEVLEIVEWREGLFRQLARSYEESPEIVNEVYRSSYVGGKKFEGALHRLFKDMGFGSEHDGGSGRKDILVVATVGPEGYNFIVEAKGSGGTLGNDEAEVAAAARHRDDVGADHAIIVARKFAGFGKEGKGGDAAILGECESTGGVSIMEIEALNEIYRALVGYSYPLPMLRDVFMTLETPARKLARIRGLTEPAEGFDYSALLEQIWERQGGAAKGEVVPYRAIFQDGHWKSSGMEFTDFECRLLALETLAAGRISVNQNGHDVYLRQSPDLILDQIEKSLRGTGRDIVEAGGADPGERRTT